MPKLSQYSLDDDRMREIIGQLWDAFTLLENRDEVRLFLSKFFTPSELEMLAKRLELIKLADTELEPRELVGLTGLSRATIYDWLEKHDAFEEQLHIVVDRLKEIERERLKKLKKKTADAGLPSHPRQGSAGKDMAELGGKIYKGYKKRKKRKSVLKNE